MALRSDPDQLHDLELLAQAAHLVYLDGPSALRAGAVYRGLRAKGQLLETADLLIAGYCLARELPLLTRNTTSHQALQPGARVEAPRIEREILKGAG